MPVLKDSEWRLICLIVRGTWGWKNATGERKESDWLTQKQIMKRTGRSSEALSRAIDSLIKINLIEVRDADGQLLRTPAQRRRAGGRLYFSVKTQLVKTHKTSLRKSEEVGTKARISVTEAEKPLGRIKNISCKSEATDYKSEVVLRKIGVRKSNTTKETESKILQKGHGHALKPRGEILDLLTLEARERRYLARLHIGWFRAGSSQPHRHRKNSINSLL